eukprot:gene30880-8584_t
MDDPKVFVVGRPIHGMRLWGTGGVKWGQQSWDAALSAAASKVRHQQGDSTVKVIWPCGAALRSMRAAGTITRCDEDGWVLNGCYPGAAAARAWTGAVCDRTPFPTCRCRAMSARQC